MTCTLVIEDDFVESILHDIRAHDHVAAQAQAQRKELAQEVAALMGLHCLMDCGPYRCLKCDGGGLVVWVRGAWDE